MTVPPYAVAALILMIASYTSDRIQSRGLMVVAGCTLGGIGYMSVLTLSTPHRFSPTMQTGFFWVPPRHTFMSGISPRFVSPRARMLALVSFLLGVSTQHLSSYPDFFYPFNAPYGVGSLLTNDPVLFFLLVTHNLGSETKRATGLPLFGAIGQVGSILGAHLYPLTEGPAYSCVEATSPSTLSRSY